ncbi:synaptonemal complex central element protein 1-like [Bubalus kerabau]|uniref:synaptonemal complex central element protein 1-like n=1 Tax=Bubalus carabanensis TaxID=3119969 RepID=UPI00244EDEB2|nr:synaptonemal complex central element protein 1-like [Bubalus carabanensis]
MAGKLEPREVKSPKVVEDGEGQTESSEKTEDLLEMVKKLQKEGSLEPQIEDLINRIHELQQAKEKSSEELGEAQALWEALRRDLDSLNGEKVHLEEVLSRKQEALRTLQLYCQRKAEEAQRLPMEEQLEDLRGPHKDLWEFHMLKRRLAWEIRALQSSQEQLLTEAPAPPTTPRPPAERQALARLEDVERLLLAPPEAPAARTAIGGLKAEPEKLRGEAPAQTRSTPEDRAGSGEQAGPQLPSEGDLAPPMELVPTAPPGQ